MFDEVALGRRRLVSSLRTSVTVLTDDTREGWNQGRTRDASGEKSADLGPADANGDGDGASCAALRPTPDTYI
jgi:hypothetical protein